MIKRNSCDKAIAIARKCRDMLGGNGISGTGRNMPNKTKTAPATSAPKTAAPKAKPVKAKKQLKTKTLKNGQTRVIRKKSPRTYPTERVSKAFRPHKHHNPTKLRASITPGTILIVLAGRFAGRRVVFLKQTKEGFLLVTGPFSVNGCPLRRFAQSYVIATSTKVDLTGVDASKFEDSYFKAPVQKKEKKSEDQFFAEDKTPKKVDISAERLANQKAVDAALLANIDKVPKLRQYLASSFSLPKGRAPHTLKF